MTTMDGDACVIDTNVLIYSTVSGNPWYQQARQWLSTLQDAGARLCVTTQILREYLVVLTRGTVFEKSFGTDQALEHVGAFLPTLTLLDEPVAAADLLRELVGRYQIRGKQIHDANIVAVMLTHGIHRLVTYNRADFVRFDEVSLETVEVGDAR
jgi:predicted nucleic acid-binding protein